MPCTPYDILVHPMIGDVSDLARHVLHVEIKAAKSFFSSMPLAVTSTPAAPLDEGLVHAAGLIGHGGAILCGDVAAILGNWDGIVAVTMT